jgi:hypothetical protein
MRHDFYFIKSCLVRSLALRAAEDKRQMWLRLATSEVQAAPFDQENMYVSPEHWMVFDYRIARKTISE